MFEQCPSWVHKQFLGYKGCCHCALLFSGGKGEATTFYIFRMCKASHFPLGLLCSLQSVCSCRNICCDSRTRDVSGGTGDKWHSSHANALPDNAAEKLRTISLIAGRNKSKKAASLHNVHLCVNRNYPDGTLFCHTTQRFFKGIGKIY